MHFYVGCLTSKPCRVYLSSKRSSIPSHVLPSLSMTYSLTHYSHPELTLPHKCLPIYFKFKIFFGILSSFILQIFPYHVILFWIYFLICLSLNSVCFLSCLLFFLPSVLYKNLISTAVSLLMSAFVHKYITVIISIMQGLLTSYNIQLSHCQCN
jgi:hypothetical protein